MKGPGIVAGGLAVNPKPHPLPPLWIGGNSQQARRRVAQYGNGWTPSRPRSMSRTTKTPPLETVEDFAHMLDELWRFVDERGRDPSDIDVAFGTPKGGAPGSSASRPLAHREGLASSAEPWVSPVAHTGSARVTPWTMPWRRSSEYGETVIAPF